MLNKYFNTLIMCLLILFFSQTVFSLIISEVMYDPTESDTYNEWIEIYNEENVTINITNLKLCNNNIFEGYIDKNNSNITNKQGYEINPSSFFIITDGGSGSFVNSNFNILNNTKLFHTDSSSLCSGLSNTGKNISINYNNKSTNFDYTNYLSKENYPPYYDFNKSNYKKGCVNGGTPGYYFECKDTEINNENYEFEYDFSIDKKTITLNNSLIFLGNITNPNDQTKANLTIKIGIRKDGGSYNYPEELILFNEEIILEKGINNLKQIINNLSWKPNDKLLSGEYKAYSRLVTRYGEKRPSQIFFLYNKANIFLNGFNINNETIKNNETIILIYNLSNEEEKEHEIQTGIEILNLKTINTGKNDYVYWCNKTIIQSKNNLTSFCIWKVPEDIISENQTYKIYPLLNFEYENQTIIKQGDSISKVFDGEKDLGEPTIEILNYQNTSFGKFSNILIKYNSKNYNLNLSFITYGYPKQVLSDYNFNGIKANDYSNSLSIKIQTKRDKEYYISLPLLTKPNCDNNYDNGKHRIRIRSFKKINEEYDELLTEDAYILIKGRNENLCKKKSERKNTQTSSTMSFSTEESKGFTYSDTRFDIVKFPPTIEKEDFIVIINATNKENITKSFWIESYLYSGNKRYSKNNIENITLKPNEKKTIELFNPINKEIMNKEYKIMLKINSSMRKTIKTYSKETEVINKRERNKILSFYTLQKKYSKNIRLYAKSEENKGSFELMSSTENQIKKIENKTFFETKLFPGINNYFLILKEGNDTIDVKRLTLFVNESNIQVLNSIKQGISVYTDIFQQKEENNGILVNSNVIKPLNYDFGREGRKKLINYLLIIVFILSFSFYIRGRYF